MFLLKHLALIIYLGAFILKVLSLFFSEVVLSTFSSRDEISIREAIH